MADSVEQKTLVEDSASAPEQPTEPTTEEANGADAMEEEEPEEDVNSKKVTLADLCAKGAALYAHKNYDEAAECYAKAAEQQADINGEMSPENAEILFLYGRSLFKVGQSKSDVLGGKAAATDKKQKKTNGTAAKPAKKNGATNGAASADAAESSSSAERITEEGIAIVADQKDSAKKDDGKLEEKKPLFQFTGDENWDDSDGEEAEGEQEEEDEEDDDLAVAFEVLDLARVLFVKRLEQLAESETSDKGKEVAEEDSSMVKHVKERLGDTHDLLAEISLENERYPNAIQDCRESLKYKEQLYPFESEIIAEAHFKLSLALEFASVTQQAGDDNDAAKGGDGAKPEQKAFDEELREEAARELEAAINSTKAKLQNKEVELATMASPEDNDVTRQQIADVKEIVADMEARLVELRRPPIDVNQALFGAGGVAAGSNPLGGILGAALGESAAATEKRIEEAKKTANDLSGLVRKKNTAPRSKDEAAPKAAVNGNGKRKAEDDADAVAAPEDNKKARVEEVAEA